MFEVENIGHTGYHFAVTCNICDTAQVELSLRHTHTRTVRYLSHPHVVYESVMGLMVRALQIITGSLTSESRGHTWSLRIRRFASLSSNQQRKDDIKVSSSSFHVLSHQEHKCATGLNGVKLDEVLVSGVDVITNSATTHHCSVLGPAQENTHTHTGHDDCQL